MPWMLVLRSVRKEEVVGSWASVYREAREASPTPADTTDKAESCHFLLLTHWLYLMREKVTLV